MYHQKCTEIIAATLKATRNQTDLQVQATLIKSFPFQQFNIDAWKVYKAEIYKQSKRVML